MKRLIFLFFSSLVFLSCSEETTSSSMKPRLEITYNPKQILQNTTYVYFSGRVYDYPFENFQSIKWTFDGADTMTGGATSFAYYIFRTAGTHKVSAAAYDDFTGEFLDSTSINVNVEPTNPQVLITPQNVDTTLLFYPGYGYVFTHNATLTAVPTNFKLVWEVHGEGIDSTYEGYYNSFSHIYQKIGTYLIKLQMIGGSPEGVLASDSTTLTIRP